LIALSAVSMGVMVGLARWREAMRPLWEDFRGEAAAWEMSEKTCIGRATVAEKSGEAAKARWYRELAVKYARRKREYQGRWW
jgi:hypothetical protein